MLNESKKPTNQKTKCKKKEENSAAIEPALPWTTTDTACCALCNKKYAQEHTVLQENVANGDVVACRLVHHQNECVCRVECRKFLRLSASPSLVASKIFVGWMLFGGWLRIIFAHNHHRPYSAPNCMAAFIFIFGVPLARMRIVYELLYRLELDIWILQHITHGLFRKNRIVYCGPDRPCGIIWIGTTIKLLCIWACVVKFGTKFE